MPKPPSEGDDLDLDFTRGAEAAPSTQKVENARLQAVSGNKEFQQSDFYVAMARRYAAPIAPSDGSESHTLLIVEDDKSLCGLLREILSAAGYTVHFAANRTEIKAEFNCGTLPDLLLLDIHLPDSDGIKNLAKLRSHPKFAQLPVIMIAGRSDAADVKRGLAAGADGYVIKPFKSSTLLAVVNSALGRA